MREQLVDALHKAVTSTVDSINSDSDTHESDSHDVELERISMRDVFIDPLTLTSNVLSVFEPQHNKVRKCRNLPSMYFSSELTVSYVSLSR